MLFLVVSFVFFKYLVKIFFWLIKVRDFNAGDPSSKPVDNHCCCNLLPGLRDLAILLANLQLRNMINNNNKNMNWIKRVYSIISSN